MASERTAAPTTRRTSSTRRPYDSPLRTQRAAQTRETLIETATELFTSNGWSNTGMRAIAQEAGVAIETLYKHFPSKRKLLDAVLDRAAAGDAQPVPVAERPEFQAMGTGRRRARIAAAAAVIAAIHDRTGSLAKLLRDAAPTDDGIAEVLRATRERQRTDVAAGLGLVLGRPPTPEERDSTWAIVSPEVYLLLTDGSGWSLDQYERWVSTTLDALLPRS